MNCWRQKECGINLLAIFREQANRSPKHTVATGGSAMMSLSYEGLEFLSQGECRLLGQKEESIGSPARIVSDNVPGTLVKLIGAYKRGASPMADERLELCAYPVGPGDLLVQVTPFTSRSSVWEMHRWTHAEARVVLLPREDVRGAAELVKVLREKRATAVCLTSEMLDAVLELSDKDPQVWRTVSGLRAIVCERYEGDYGCGRVPPALASGSGPRFLTFSEPSRPVCRPSEGSPSGQGGVPGSADLGRCAQRTGPDGGASAAMDIREQGFEVEREKVYFPFDLTQSEMSVSRLVAEGMTNKEIAVRLALSVHTVGSHIRSAFAKVDVNNRVELARAIIFYECDSQSSMMHMD